MVPILMQTCKRVAFYHPRTKNKVTGFQGKLLLLIRIHVHVRGADRYQSYNIDTSTPMFMFVLSELDYSKVKKIEYAFLSVLQRISS